MTKSAFQIENDFMRAVQDAKSNAGVRLRGRKAQKWLRDNIIDLYGKYNPSKRMNILKGDPQSLITKNNKLWPGKMYMYYYDPKTKKELPYYDIFPLVFVMEIYDDGFLGLNLHYLPPQLRVVLFKKLLKLRNNRRFDDSTKLKLSYRVIKRFGRFKFAAPCIKRYLTDYIRSNLREVEPEFWEIAIFLPTESFRKTIKEVVWNDSRKQVRKGKQRYWL